MALLKELITAGVVGGIGGYICSTVANVIYYTVDKSKYSFSPKFRPVNKDE